MRFLLRMTGYGLIALGFITTVLDGARSIANAGLQATRLDVALQAILHKRFEALGPLIARSVHPWLADPAFVTIMQVPLAIVLLLLGFGLLRLGRPPVTPIGFVTRQ